MRYLYNKPSLSRQLIAHSGFIQLTSLLIILHINIASIFPLWGQDTNSKAATANEYEIKEVMTPVGQPQRQLAW